MDHIGVLIPAYNAEATLPALLTQVGKIVPTRDIVVVDDGSSDATSEIASRLGAEVARHRVNCGKGRALQTGFDYVLQNVPWDAVVTMDADLQHRPEDLPSFMNMYRYLSPDIVIGYRSRWGTSMPIARRVSNTITSALVSARTGITVKDSQCGYRLIARHVLEEVKIESPGYEAETEFLIKAVNKGFHMRFIQIQAVYGSERSYMTHWITTKRFLSVLLKEY